MLPTTRTHKLKNPHPTLIVDGTYTSNEKCVLNFFGKDFELFIMEDSFPISTSGMLGLDWEKEFKVSINREFDTCAVKVNGTIFSLEFGKHPLASIPPQSFTSCQILSKKPDGSFFFEGSHIVPGIYRVQGAKVTLNLFNDSNDNRFLYRENIISKSRNDFVRDTEEYIRILYAKSGKSSSSNLPGGKNLLCTILNDKLPQDDRKHALIRYYQNNVHSPHERESTKIFSTQNHSRISEILAKFSTQINNIKSRINSNVANNVSDLITEYNDIFVLPNDPLPAVTDVEHEIKLITDKIISTPLYKHPLFMQDEIERQINDFKAQGLIRDSHSPYQSNVWLVPRKIDLSGNKKWRLVMDFRKLNSFTQQDNYPLPSIDEILSLLGRARYLSSFDMSNGFHAVKVKAEDIPKTAFSTHKGHWEWLRMPMGLINSPATYQRMMNFKLRGLIGKVCFIYVDDLIIFGTTPEEHLKNLRMVFDRIRETRLMFNPDKCAFLQQELEYLGHEVTPEGIKPLKRNVEKVLNFPQPRNKKELEQFLGLASYYRKFICNFARKTHRLNRLKSKNVDFDFNEQCIEEFHEIRKVLGTYPLIRHPDNSRPFILHTDASNEGIGAVLSQIHPNGKEYPCYFISRSLNAAEKNYSPTEKELLAAVWAMKKLKYFLYGQKFDLYTDHQALRGIFRNKSDDVSSRIVRLLSKTTDYHPNIIYKKGKENVVADALSRAFVTTRNQQKVIEKNNEANKLIEFDEEKETQDTPDHVPYTDTPELEVHLETEEEESREEDIRADKNQEQISEVTEDLTDPCLEVAPKEERIIYCGKNAFLWLDKDRSVALLKEFDRTKNKTKKFIVSKYISDDDLQKIMSKTTSIIRLDDIVKIPPIPLLETDDLGKAHHEIESARLQNVADIETLIDVSRSWKGNDIVSIQATRQEEYDRAFNILNAFLYWSRLNIKIRKFLPKYIADENSRITLIAKIHEKHHWGVEKCYQELRVNYIWNGMKTQFKDYIQKCSICAPLRRTLKHTAPGVIIEAPTEPFEIINCDLFTNDSKLYLVFIDELSRYVWVHQNVQKAQVYRHMRSFFLQHGIPKRLITDNGKEFDNHMVSRTCESFAIQKIPISAYHPESNGVCERVIGTLKQHLEKTDDVSLTVFQYNNSVHSVLRRTPISVLYGIRPKIITEEPDREKEIEATRRDVSNEINRQKIVNKKLIDLRQSTSRSYRVGDLIELYVQKNNKGAWSDPTPVLTCNENTKTITAKIGNILMQRHFNQIRPHTQNRDILSK